MRGFVQDIEALAVKNAKFRQVLYTAKHCQLVLGTVHQTRQDAEADHEHFDGKTTE